MLCRRALLQMFYLCQLWYSNQQLFGYWPNTNLEVTCLHINWNFFFLFNNSILLNLPPLNFG